jgi:hypothetical protein
VTSGYWPALDRYMRLWQGVDCGFALGPDGAVVAFGRAERGALGDGVRATRMARAPCPGSSHRATPLSMAPPCPLISRQWMALYRMSGAARRPDASAEAQGRRVRNQREAPSTSQRSMFVLGRLLPSALLAMSGDHLARKSLRKPWRKLTKAAGITRRKCRGLGEGQHRRAPAPPYWGAEVGCRNQLGAKAWA